jgi:hypothetical protein
MKAADADVDDPGRERVAVVLRHGHAEGGDIRKVGLTEADWTRPCHGAAA